jgi:Copper transport outer membrane protein, MctB
VIDFRYHLVSIVAVFLALAVGIVVGVTELQPGVVRSLRALSTHEKKQIDSLLAEQRALKQQVSAQEAFAQTESPRLLAGLLTGQEVVIVAAPGADSQTISGVSIVLQQAGAKVTGQLTLQPLFFDTSAANESGLNGLAQQLAPAGLGLGSRAADPRVSGQQAAARVIAAAVITGNSRVWSAAQSQRILSGFGRQGYLQVSGGAGGSTLPGPATLAVVIIPATPPASDTNPANLALVALAQQLRMAGHGTVVAGSLPGSGAGSAIDEILSTAATQLTTVDDADTEIGQITVALALRDLLDGRKPASYGITPGIFPIPAPSSAPSSAAVAADPAAATPTPTPSAHRAVAKRARQPGSSR